MRIAMVSEHANPLATLGGVDAGGQNVHVAALASHLSSRGHDVTVFTRRDDADSPPVITTDEGYRVEHVPAGPPADVPKDQLLPYMDEFADVLRRRWSQDPVDIAHAHFWMSGLAAVEAGRSTGVPVVQTFHALGSVKRRHQGRGDTSPPTRIDSESRLCRTVAHVIATCTDEVHELAMLGLPVGRSTIIPCGVDLTTFQPTLPPMPADGRRRRLLAIGRLVERKGLADVITALAQVPDAELIIAGGPPADVLALDEEANRLRATAARHGVDDRVTLLGAVDHADMPRLIATADIVVTAPWYEPFGIVPLEAMACARPVVATAVGGLCDTVVPCVTGELVPPRDPDALAAALQDLLADPRRRTQYGAAGRRRVERSYSWATVARDTEDVYAAVAARHLRASRARRVMSKATDPTVTTPAVTR